MGLLCKLPKQVNSIFSKGKGLCNAKGAQDTNPQSTICEEMLGMVVTKMLDAREKRTLTMKLKFIRNRAIFKETNSTHEMVTFDSKEMLGIVDIRSLVITR